MYISSLPIINYPYYETNKKIVFKQATNITTRVKISEYVRKYRTNFTDYTILDAERPDTLSNRLYDSPKYDWILFLVNDIINPYYSWPMSSHDLNLYIKEKYKTSSFFVPDLWKRKNSYSVVYKKLEELSNENLFDSSFFQEKNVNSNFFYSINSNTPFLTESSTIGTTWSCSGNMPFLFSKLHPTSAQFYWLKPIWIPPSTGEKCYKYFSKNFKCQPYMWPSKESYHCKKLLI